MTFNITTLDEVDSTNDYAKKIARQSKEGTVITARAQTAGKGRLGRSWQGRPGDDIAMSIILKPPIAPDTVYRLTLLGGLCVMWAIEEVSGLSPLIKWPNDVILSGKKVCGILTESGTKGGVTEFAVIGIGVNVNNNTFEGELAHKATSLFLESHRIFPVDVLRDKILDKIKEHYPVFLENGFPAFIADYKERCVNIGREITVVQEYREIKGICRDISLDGLLIIEENGSLLKILSGEASVRGIYED